MKFRSDEIIKLILIFNAKERRFCYMYINICYQSKLHFNSLEPKLHEKTTQIKLKMKCLSLGVSEARISTRKTTHVKPSSVLVAT